MALGRYTPSDRGRRAAKAIGRELRREAAKAPAEDHPSAHLSRAERRRLLYQPRRTS